MSLILSFKLTDILKLWLFCKVAAYTHSMESDSLQELACTIFCSGEDFISLQEFSLFGV